MLKALMVITYLIAIAIIMLVFWKICIIDIVFAFIAPLIIFPTVGVIAGLIIDKLYNILISIEAKEDIALGVTFKQSIKQLDRAIKEVKACIPKILR
jgi:hypothetical protein